VRLRWRSETTSSSRRLRVIGIFRLLGLVICLLKSDMPPRLALDPNFLGASIQARDSRLADAALSRASSPACREMNGDVVIVGADLVNRLTKALAAERSGNNSVWPCSGGVVLLQSGRKAAIKDATEYRNQAAACRAASELGARRRRRYAARSTVLAEAPREPRLFLPKLTEENLTVQKRLAGASAADPTFSG
jgi:hypothetical protein